MQRGLINAQATLDWVKAQQKSGALASTFTDVVVAGCSAGSIGAQLWGNQVIKSLSWKKASIMPDSYAGLFPDGVEGPLVYNYGFCNSGFLNEANYEKCMNQQIRLRDMNDQFMTELPSIPYSFIQSKTDIVQESFYVATGVLCKKDAAITPAEFYAGVNDIFEVRMSCTAVAATH